MVTQMIQEIESFIEEEGLVIIGRKKYDRFLKKLLEQEREIKRMREERIVDEIIALGEKELSEGKTIVAQSSKAALEIFYGRKKENK